MRHGRFVPLRLAQLSPFERGRDDVMAILENIRFHRQIIADDAFDHVAPAVHERLQVLNNSGGKGP
jgi:hypothetical protein